jgi:hypothetical protein
MVSHHLGKLCPVPGPASERKQDQFKEPDPYPHPDPDSCGRSQCRRRASKWSHGRRLESL